LKVRGDGWLAGFIGFEHLQEVAALAGRRMEREFIVFGPRGEVLAHAAPEGEKPSADPEAVWRSVAGKKPVSADALSPAGKLFCVSRDLQIRGVKGLFLKAAALKPHAQAFWTLRTLGVFIISALALLTAFVVLGGLYQSRKLTRPLATFVEKIRDIRRGNLEARTAIDTDDEIGYLSQSFDAMVDSVRRAQKDLEEKNALLEDANRRLKDQLMAAEKTSIIGQIASGLHHNLKNAAFLIKGCVATCASEKDDGKREALLRTIGETLEKMTGTIDPLLYFARDESSARELVSLRELLEDTVKIVLPYLRDNLIQLDAEYGDAPPVSIIAGQVQQVVLNLLLNAKDACGGNKGRVSLTLGSREESGRRFASIEISDRGKGIPKENMDRLFQPFYSTKPSSVGPGGTGIGLFISRIITESNGGTIALESREGEGTSVTVHFPGAGA
jgi:two-component system NtrC family sensor kinase